MKFPEKWSCTTTKTLPATFCIPRKKIRYELHFDHIQTDHSLPFCSHWILHQLLAAFFIHPPPQSAAQWPEWETINQQNKVNSADSAFIILIIQSQSQWYGWSGRRRWSCLVWSLLDRKKARMILIQNIQGLMGPLMIHMAFMPSYMWEMWDVTPVRDARTHKQWKVEQYSAWAESAILMINNHWLCGCIFYRTSLVLLTGLMSAPTCWHVLIMTFMNATVPSW